MPRTLVISDLHVGALAAHCILERPAVRAGLAERIGPLDRLVLLGDLLELREGRLDAEVFAIADPVLATLAGLAPEIAFVPGNHDRRLVAPWITDQGTRLGVAAEVPPTASVLLSDLVARLGAAGATVSVHYPGLWLGPGIYATHGHYLDPALAPPGPYGLFFRPPARTCAQIERIWQRPLRHGVLGVAKHRILRPQMAPLVTRLLDAQMRRHSLPALAHVLGALEVDADWVIFGHVHRLGPLPGDDPAAWTHPLAPGRPPARFLNTGAWVAEELLIGPTDAAGRPATRRRAHQPGARADGRHPYWPGSAIEITGDGIPRAIELHEPLR